MRPAAPSACLLLVEWRAGYCPRASIQPSVVIRRVSEALALSHRVRTCADVSVGTWETTDAWTPPEATVIRPRTVVIVVVAAVSAIDSGVTSTPMAAEPPGSNCHEAIGKTTAPVGTVSARVTAALPGFVMTPSETGTS